MIKKLLKIWPVFVVCCFLVSTCIDPVDFKTEKPEPLLVVEGQLTTSDKENFVYLSQVSEYGKTFRVPLEGAQVFIVRENGDEIPMTEVTPGYFELPDPLLNKGVVGAAYYLRVILQDGTVYRTDPEVMPEPVPIDSVLMKISNQSNGQIDISVNTTFPDHTVWLRYKVKEDYAFTEATWSIFVSSKTCYFTLPALTPFRIATNDQNNAERLDNFLVGTRKGINTLEFSRGRHYFSVHQYAGTQNAYLYFDKLNKLLSLNGSVFDSAPAAITGNLYREDDPGEKALGYFEIANVDIKRVFTYPPLIRIYFPNPDHCDLSQVYYYSLLPPECCNCLGLYGATLTKPYWWE